jgi:protocatechuate 3,4-dioxygenase beta subunit
MAVKRLVLAAAFVLAAVLAAGLRTPVFAAADQEQQARSLQGQVMNGNDAPLPEAIVYLKNTKTMTVKTFIAGKDGNYRFNALSPNVDYEVYAEHNGKRSDTKTLSSFDSRKSATINLRVK